MRRDLLIRITALAGSLLIGLVVAELVLRAVGFSYPSFYGPDPVLGRANIPHAFGWFADEGGSWVEINGDGLRDREHDPAKPPGTIRIAVLGDSFAAAFQVPPEQTFWGLLQPDLQGCAALGSRRVEAINFGVVGFGTAQEYLMLQSRVWKYQPDVVLLAFLTANDVSDNVRELKQSGQAPYFLRRDGALALDPEFAAKSAKLAPGALDGIGNWLYARSRLVQLVAKASRSLQPGADGEGPRRTGLVEGQEPGLYEEVYREPADPTWNEAWAVTEDLLRAIAADVRAHGARLLLATLSNGIQVHPDPAVRQAFAARFGIADLFYPDRRIEAFAAAEGIPYLMLAPGMQAWAETHRQCVHGFDNAMPCFGHWNAEGHRLAGAGIADALCRQIVPELRAAAS